MNETTEDQMRGGHLRVSAVLFLCLFASQAAVIAMSPGLAEAARDLDVSTAAAGQLRTITGLAAGITALALGAVAGRIGLARQLLAAAALLALGSLASAAAPSFELLALAQVPVGIAVAVLTTAGTLAAAEWVSPELRTRTLSWTLVGQPAAWIVGMPLIGFVDEWSWRLGWLVLPLLGAVLAGALVASRARQPASGLRPAPTGAVLRDRSLATWLAGEVLANAAWAGTLVFAGSLFVESYGISPGLTGVLLAVAAAAYVAGNMSGRRLVRGELRRTLVLLAAFLAVADGLFGVVRPGIGTSTVLFSIAAFAAGARTLVASAFALATPPELRPATVRLRAATMQLGYFAGSIAAGAALAVGGYGALGLAMALFFVGAAVVASLASRDGLSTSRPSRGLRRRRAAADRGRQAARAARGAAPEREPHRRPGAAGGRPLGRGRAGVGREDGADPRLPAPQGAA